MKSGGALYVPAMPSITTAELIPVIGYVRVSTWREEMISVDIQKSVIKEASARKGRYVAEWIEDPDATGRDFKRKIMGAIEMVEAVDNPLREIWVWKFSRFGRNRHGVAINLARIEDVGGELVSATEEVDAKSAAGRFTRGMLLEVAAFESDRAGEQWKETHELRRSMGLPASGGRRFGYRWHPRRLPDGEGGWKLQDEWYEVIGSQAEACSGGYQLYIAGKTGFRRIAQDWRAAGFRTARGAEWQDQTVKLYLDSGFAAGLLIVHKQDAICGSPAECQKRDHYGYRPAEHESIIGTDEWEDYLDRREIRKITPRRSLEPTYPLSGLVKCGICTEARMPSTYTKPVMSRGRPSHAYRCGAMHHGHIKHESVWTRRQIIEDEVFDWLLRVREEIDAIVAGRIVIPTPREQPGSEAKRRKLRADISKFTAALDRASEGHALGDIPRDSYLRTRDKFTQERDEAQRQLDELDEEAQPQPTPLPHQETVQGLIKDWDTISVKAKRVTLAPLIRRVEIWPEGRVVVVPVWPSVRSSGQRA